MNRLDTRSPRWSPVYLVPLTTLLASSPGWAGPSNTHYANTHYANTHYANTHYANDPDLLAEIRACLPSCRTNATGAACTQAQARADALNAGTYLTGVCLSPCCLDALGAKLPAGASAITDATNAPRPPVCLEDAELVGHGTDGRAAPVESLDGTNLFLVVKKSASPSDLPTLLPLRIVKAWSLSSLKAASTADCQGGLSPPPPPPPVGTGPKEALYQVEVKLGDGVNDWVPYCGYEAGTAGGDPCAGQPVLAIPLKGAWDTREAVVTGGSRVNGRADLVTFACLDGALGKCAAPHYIGLPSAVAGEQCMSGIGYSPWKLENVQYQTPGGILAPPDDYLEACTRMVRADYCGDGISFTDTGEPIDVWDQLVPPVNDYVADASYRYEASWKSTGAADLHLARVWSAVVSGITRLILDILRGALGSQNTQYLQSQLGCITWLLAHPSGDPTLCLTPNGNQVACAPFGEGGGEILDSHRNLAVLLRQLSASAFGPSLGLSRIPRPRLP